ncbi:cingulin-like [Acipenser ruthenus]|uniref:cingulin-like n=1 Tax=Acipenser ruthenus TaxID=7906 RepID=UPI0027420510|nr:cingulin-like [Acipenser ruthenus]XP_058862066.1 cingulin-like [Acipenser ruthenus]XP_058862067.1 cingulin-like [Acipenser ruthenus]
MDPSPTADRPPPLDYGVQIRFIDDLNDRGKPRKKTGVRADALPQGGGKGKGGSYGVAVRVQGIAGQPYLVLKEGEKGDSYGVQLKSSDKRGSEPPENPYPQPGYERSDGTGLRTSRGAASPPAPQPRRTEDLRRSHSHESLLEAGSLGPGFENLHGDLRKEEGNGLERQGRNSSSSRDRYGGDNQEVMSSRSSSSSSSITAKPSARGGTPEPGGAIDTKSLPTVGSMISKFDGGQGPQRGRAGGRSRISTDERKRSRSLDGRNRSGRDSLLGSLDVLLDTPASSSPSVVNGQALSPSHSSASLGRPAQEPTVGSVTSSTRDRIGGRTTTSSQLKVQSEIQLKSTPDLLQNQRQLGSEEERAKEALYTILREGSSDNENSVKRKVNLVFEKIQAFKSAAPSSDSRTLLMQKNELERRASELQMRLDEETKNRLNSSSRLDTSVQSLRSELEETLDENIQLQEVLSQTKSELHSSVTELMQLRMEKEALETRVRGLEDHLSGLQEELRGDGESGAVKEALEVDVMELRAGLAELYAAKQKQDELLHQRERELTALKGALKDEVASHDSEMDRLREQYHSDMEQLRSNVLEVSQTQLDVEAERQKVNATVRTLQRQLEESSDESSHWRELLQKSKEELRSTKRELLQARADKEELEEELQEVRGRFASMQVEVDSVRTTVAQTEQAERLEKELQRCREELQQALSQREQHGETLAQRDRELAALRGALQDQGSKHQEELETLQQSLQREREQGKRSRDEEAQDRVSQQALRSLEARLTEAGEESALLRKRGAALELQVTESQHAMEELEAVECRLRDRLSHAEAERRQLESSLHEASEAEEGLALEKRSLESQLQEAQRSLARLRQEKEDLGERLQEEASQREELRRGKSELEEQKRLLDRTVEKLNKELDRMTAESRGLVTQVQAQLEEFKDKSRKDLLEAQRQGKERVTELERAQGHLHRNQEEISRLKQELLSCQEERDNALLDKELLTNRLQHLEGEIESKRRSQDERSRNIKGLEDKIKRLELELDEERSTVELQSERMDRSRDQVDHLRAELMQERSLKQDLECDKMSLERQIKDLKSRLSIAEGSQKPSTSLTQLEARIQELDERLQIEERDKSAALSSNRKLERKVKELNIQLEDERQQQQDQREQLTLRVKALKRQVDLSEEELERLENGKKKAVRDLEEQLELREQLQNRIKALEKEAWRKSQREALEASLLRAEDLSSEDEEEEDREFDPAAITSLLTKGNLKTSSC